MREEYTNQLGAFQYRGHTIEAHVARTPARQKKGSARQAGPGTWILQIEAIRYPAFPATPHDTADNVRERIKRWVDEHLP
jgi:hypothetical protein